MALTYDSNEQMKTLYPVLEEYAEWHGRIMRGTIYPETHEDKRDLAVPEAFKIWMDDVKENDLLDEITIEHIVRQHADLHVLANDLIHAAFSSNEKPDVQVFDSFSDRYEAFIVQLRRLERDSVQTGSRLDIETGLLSAQAMKKDMEREMARRSRRGKPFCIVLVRIDRYEGIVESHSEDELHEMMKTIAAQIKKCVRTFDDAYRASVSEFIMTLKSTDVTGASAAVARLRRYIEEAAELAAYNDGSGERLTMSYCLADPVPGDEMEKLMDSMRGDLNGSSDQKDVMLEFFEASPLSRYIEALGD